MSPKEESASINSAVSPSINCCCSDRPLEREREREEQENQMEKERKEDRQKDRQTVHIQYQYQSEGVEDSIPGIKTVGIEHVTPRTARVTEVLVSALLTGIPLNICLSFCSHIMA